MPLHRRSLALLLGLALVSGLAAAGPLTEEEVVRIFVGGATTDELLQEIEAREPDLDTSPEMLTELLHAGLPRAVIDAMVRRQRLHDSQQRETAEIEQSQSNPLLIFKLDGTKTVSVGERIDPQLAAEWELGNAPEDRVFADVALYVACHTGDHVPDQWRNKSPLGRDFSSMRRHKMLNFITAAAGSVEDGDQGRRIKLALPGVIEVPLEPGIAHDLTLGLAVQIGGHYRRVTDDRQEGLILDQAGLELSATIKGREPRRFRVRFDSADDELDDESLDDDVSRP